MADDKTRAKENARKVAEWLMGREAEFEGDGVDEKSVAAAIGLSEDEAVAAVDYLENREEVVRMPHGTTAPSQFLLKPGRGWPDMKNEIGKSATG